MATDTKIDFWKKFITIGYLEQIINSYSHTKFSNGIKVFEFKNELNDGSSIKILNNIGLRTTDLSIAFINNTDNPETLKFNTDETYNSGYIRNIYINLEVVRNAFQNNDTLRNAIVSILNSINSVFLGYWDFHLKVNESTQCISIVDKNFINEKLNDVRNNIFEFKMHGGNSIIKSLSVNSKLSNEIGMTSLYSINVDNKGANHILNNDSDAFTSIWNDTKNTECVYKDKFIGTLLPLDNTDINFKVNMEIKPTDSSINKQNKSYTSPAKDTKNKYDIAQQIQSNTDSYLLKLSQKIENSEHNLKFSTDCKNSYLPSTESEIYKPFVTSERDTDVDVMRSCIYRKSTSINQTGKSVMIIPIDFEMQISGISGIRLGDIFTVDALPTAYKNNSVLQVMGVTHVIKDNIWDTTINAGLRIFKFDDNQKEISPPPRKEGKNIIRPGKWETEADEVDEAEVVNSFKGKNNLIGVDVKYTMALLSYKAEAASYHKFPKDGISIELPRAPKTNRAELKLNIKSVLRILIDINNYLDNMNSSIAGNYYVAKINSGFRSDKSGSSHSHALALDLSFWTWNKKTKKLGNVNSDKDIHIKIVNMLVNNVLKNKNLNQILCEFNSGGSCWLHIDTSPTTFGTKFYTKPGPNGTMNGNPNVNKFYDPNRINEYYNPF